VSFRARQDITLTPCGLRDAVCALAGSNHDLARLLGLAPGPIHVEVIEGVDDVGLGVYRATGTPTQRHAFSTVLPSGVVEGIVHAAIEDLRSDDELSRQLDETSIGLAYDPALDVCAVTIDCAGADCAGYPNGECNTLTELALRLAAPCVAERLTTSAAS
jgi:hypothetical protein